MSVYQSRPISKAWFDGFDKIYMEILTTIERFMSASYTKIASKTPELYLVEFIFYVVLYIIVYIMILLWTLYRLHLTYNLHEISSETSSLSNIGVTLKWVAWGNIRSLGKILKKNYDHSRKLSFYHIFLRSFTSIKSQSDLELVHIG